MRRRLRQLLVLLCLILALATAGLWLRSEWRAYGVRYQRSSVTADGSAYSARAFGLASMRSRLQVWSIRADWSGYPPASFINGAMDDGWYFNNEPVGRSAGLEGLLGFAVKSEPSSRSVGAATSRRTVTALQFPHWFLVLLLSIPSAVTAVRAWRRRRVIRAMGPAAVPCPACGYDCRATPGRCPECGHAATPAKSQLLT